MLIISHIFYIFGFLFFINNFKILLKFNNYYYLKEWYIKFQNVTGSRPKSQDFRTKEDYTTLKNKNILSIFEIIWLCVGIFTNNWIIFLFLLLVNLIANINSSNISIIDRFFSFFYILMKSIIYLVLFINEFHLRMNLLDFICSFF
jgi:hypothetical protein